MNYSRPSRLPRSAMLDVLRPLALSLLFLTAILAFFYSPIAQAQESCGDITYIDIFNGDEQSVEPILDCENPFGVTDSPSVGVTYTSNGEVFGNGDDLVLVSTSDTLFIELWFDQRIASVRGVLFLHEGENYRQVAHNQNPGVVQMSVVEVGTYTLVTTVDTNMPVQVFNNAWFNFLIPTAHAQPPVPGAEVFAITFTVTTPEPEPIGASSVLFLPGIMGSKLYEQGQQCDDSGNEQQRWFSISACEQLRLLTRFDGTSRYGIYTKAEDGAVIDKIFISTLYDSFMQNMNNLEEAGVITDFIPFAYDWRLQLDDLLKMTKDPLTDEVRLDTSIELEAGYLYQTIQTMAEESLSGNVTIVAHSNGGLLAKTFMSALQARNDPLLEKIDNIILVASPQVGTPDAVVGMLQGSEIGTGYIASQATTRQLLNTAPFGHHLLPNKNYFSGAGTQVFSPTISFKAGTSTDDWINIFGSQIADSETLHQFLSKDSGRIKPQTNDLKHPEVVDNFLLNYADTIAAVIDSWVPGPNTKVYQIAGTGLETVSGITYFTDAECIARGFLWYECTEYMPKLGYYINFTFDGDRTVVTPSALAMQEKVNVERLWLDLNAYNEINADRVHRNILEVPDVIDFIQSIIQAVAPTSARYLSDTRINPDAEERLSFFLLSPLDMYLESAAGITSSTTADIPGATYRRYGEVQYVSVPVGITGVTLQLRGYQAGSFSLLAQKHDGEVVENTFDFTAVATGSSTIVQLPLDGITEDTVLEIDFDGDGVVDGVVTSQTDVVTPTIVLEIEDELTEPLITEVRLTTQTSGTRVRPPSPLDAVGIVAGVTISADEQWYYKELQNILEDITELLVLIKTQYEK
jgi:hypothetical protein